MITEGKSISGIIFGETSFEIFLKLKDDFQLKSWNVHEAVTHTRVMGFCDVRWYLQSSAQI